MNVIALLYFLLSDLMTSVWEVMECNLNMIEKECCLFFTPLDDVTERHQESGSPVISSVSESNAYRITVSVGNCLINHKLLSFGAGPLFCE